LLISIRDTRCKINNIRFLFNIFFSLKDLCEELEKSQKEIKSLQEAFDQKPAESAGDPSCQCKSDNKVKKQEIVKTWKQ